MKITWNFLKYHKFQSMHYQHVHPRNYRWYLFSSPKSSYKYLWIKHFSKCTFITFEVCMNMEGRTYFTRSFNTSSWRILQSTVIIWMSIWIWTRNACICKRTDGNFLPRSLHLQNHRSPSTFDNMSSGFLLISQFQ